MKTKKTEQIIQKNVSPIIDTPNTNSPSSRQSETGEEVYNIYITGNITYGDVLQTTTGSLTRIFCQNINGIEFSHFTTLESVCDSVRKCNIDIAGLFETDLHFANPKSTKQFNE